jgi:hypothetical protein
MMKTFPNYSIEKDRKTNGALSWLSLTAGREKRENIILRSKEQCEI